MNTRIQVVGRGPSLRGRLLELYLRASGRKHQDHLLWQRIAHGRQPDHARPPRHLYWRHRIDRREVFGSTVWTLAPAGRSAPLHVLFLHGGVYVNGLIGKYWRFLAGLVDALQCTIVVPEYPLAPRHHAGEVHALVLTLYRELGAACDGQGLAVMGASSGGGIALALAQQLPAHGIPEPARLILVSPWLDVSMSNPALTAANRRDPLLDLDGLREAGRLYAGERAVTDPLVSPIYGSLAGLPPLTLLTGTHDVLLPDARRFRDLATAAGVDLDYFEYPGMVHEWTLLRLPEARAACRVIVRALASAMPVAGVAPGPPRPGSHYA